MLFYLHFTAFDLLDVGWGGERGRGRDPTGVPSVHHLKMVTGMYCEAPWTAEKQWRESGNL